MGAQRKRLAAGGPVAIAPSAAPLQPNRRKAQMPKFKEGDRIMLEAVIVATADTGYTIRIIEGSQDTQTHHLLRVGLGIEEHAVLKP
jgi:hypothetical protein